MLKSRDVWQIFQTHVPRGEWVDLSDLYDVVRKHGQLGQDDLAAISARTSTPHWKRTVRNALQRGKAHGEVDWDGKGRYRFG